MRFGAAEAHGQGAAMQYGYLKAKGAFTWDGSTRRYRIDDAKMEAGIRDLVHDIVLLQGNGHYAGVKAFLARYAVRDERAAAVIGSMKDIQIDIKTAYPDKASSGS